MEPSNETIRSMQNQPIHKDGHRSDDKIIISLLKQPRVHQVSTVFEVLLQNCCKHDQKC